MKAKTKYQKEIYALSRKLKPVSKTEVNWYIKHFTHKWYRIVRNRVICLECSHKDTLDKFGVIAHAPTVGSDQPRWTYRTTYTEGNCPNCKSKVNYTEDPRHETNHYMAKLEVCDNKQVVRIIRLNMYYSKKHKPIYFHSEVIQSWLAENKPSIFLMKMKKSTFNLSDEWCYHTKLEMRSNVTIHSSAINLNPHVILPKREVLPILIRNGFNGNFHDVPPIRLFDKLLHDNRAECLLKLKQSSLLSYYIYQKSNEVNEKWNSILIASKHNYIVQNASNWIDYLNMLVKFNKDLKNPFYICPENLAYAHNRYLAKLQQLTRQQKLEELKKQIETNNITYKKRIAKFEKLVIKDKGITITPLLSVQEFLIESDELAHCAFENSYYNKRGSLVLSAKVDNKRTETIELSLNNFTILQAGGYDNEPSPYHDEIVSLVKNNIKQIKKLAK